MSIPKATVFVAIMACAAAVGCGSSDVEPITGDLVVSMTMNSLPAQLPINQATTPDGRVEYSWNAIFDVNNSGTIDQGDLALSVLQAKLPGATEEMSPVDGLQAGLWNFTANNSRRFESVIAIQVVGDTIRLAVDRTTFMPFGDITATTGIHFGTLYYDSVTDRQYYDYVPARDTFQDLSASGQATDPSDDVADFNGSGSLLFPWSDITEATVSLR